MKELDKICIIYDKSITEDIYNRLIEKLVTLGYIPSKYNNFSSFDYKTFSTTQYKYLSSDCKSNKLHLDNNHRNKTNIKQISDFINLDEKLQISDFIESNQLKPEDLVKDKWYYCIPYSENWIFKFSYLENSLIYSNGSSNLEKGYLSIVGKINSWCSIKDALKKGIRPATKEEVLKYFPDEKFEEEHPEYYECYKTTSDSFSIGKIYKIINPRKLNDYSNFIDNFGKTNGYSGQNEQYFKPSTKEAFDLQNFIKQETQLVEGKWYSRQHYSKDFIKFKYLEIVNGLNTKYNRVHYSELIEYGKHSYTSNYWSNDEMEKYALENPVTLEEIQQYLPNSHVDKIKPKTMETKLDKEELLRIAKEKFPIGTKFKGVAGLDKDKILTVGDMYARNIDILNSMGVYCGNSYLVLFDNPDIWAEIISLPESKSEEFKVIPNTDNGYEINRDGLVRNIKTGSYISKSMSSKGYYKLNLFIEGKSYNRVLHRLIAQTFIENPNNYETVDHIDGDKLNNNISNLRWCTLQENNLYYKESGGKWNSSLSEEDIKDIYLNYNNYGEQKEACEKYNVSKGTISLIKSGKSFSHITNSINLDNFPEKWCIKSNSEIVNVIANFWDKTMDLTCYNSCKKQYQDYYWYSHNIASGNSMFGNNPGSNHCTKELNNKFTEITFEQFKAKFIDKDDIQEYGVYISPIPPKEFSNISIKEYPVTIEESYKPKLFILSKPSIVSISTDKESAVKINNNKQLTKI